MQSVSSRPRLPFAVLAPGDLPPPSAIGLTLSPGPGWGTGAHPTTRLCLQAIRFHASESSERWKALDFGSGSGLLSLAAARLGAHPVDGVEIDEQGLLHAVENVRLNGLGDRIAFRTDLAELPGPYDLVVANILRPTLLEFASELGRRVDRARGRLILSGLVATDVPELSARYSAILERPAPHVHRLADAQGTTWCALVWPRPDR